MTVPKSPWADELLRRVRATADPKPSDALRVLAGIERQLGSTGAARAAVEELPEPAARGGASVELERRGSRVAAGSRGASPLARLMWGAGFGLAMGGLGYWWGWQSHAAQVQRARVQSPALEVETPALEMESAPPPVAPSPVPEVAPPPLGAASAPLEAVSSPVPSELAPPRVASREPAQPARRRASRSRVGKAADAKVEHITLRDAIDQLQRAQLALRRGEPRAALELVSDLDRRSPWAMLREERLATRALAWCELGERERAGEAFGELRDTEARSIYQPRLEESCGLELGEVQKD